MTRSRWAAVSMLVAVLGAVMAPAAAAAPSGRERPDAVPTARVGAASRSALPLVDGSLDYLDAGLPSETDPTSPGVFVEDFDDGPITVGNGEPDAQWVHDDVRLRAMAIEALRGNGPIAVLLAADLYMIFRPDADEIPPRQQPSCRMAWPSGSRSSSRPPTTTTAPTRRSTSTTSGTTT